MDLGVITESSLKDASFPIAPLNKSLAEQIKKTLLKETSAQEMTSGDESRVNLATGLKAAHKKQKRRRPVKGHGKSCTIRKITNKPGNSSTQKHQSLQTAMNFSQNGDKSSTGSIATKIVNSKQLTNEIYSDAIPGPSWFYPPNQTSKSERVGNVAYYKQPRHTNSKERMKQIEKSDSSTSAADDSTDEDNAIPSLPSFYPPRRKNLLKRLNDSPYERLRREDKSHRMKQSNEEKNVVVRLNDSEESSKESSEKYCTDSSPTGGQVTEYVHDTALKLLEHKTNAQIKRDPNNKSKKRPKILDNISVPKGLFFPQKFLRSSSSDNTKSQLTNKEVRHDDEEMQNGRRRSEDSDGLITMTRNVDNSVRRCSISSGNFENKHQPSQFSMESYLKPATFSGSSSPFDITKLSQSRIADKAMENKRISSESFDELVSMMKNGNRVLRRCSNSFESFDSKDRSSQLSLSPDSPPAKQKCSYKLLVARNTDSSKIDESDDGYNTRGSSSLSSTYDALNSVRSSTPKSSDFKNGKEQLASTKADANQESIVTNMNTRSMRDEENTVYETSNHVANINEVIRCNSSENNSINLSIEYNVCTLQKTELRKTSEPTRQLGLFQELLNSGNNNFKSRHFLKSERTTPWFADPVRTYRERPPECSENEEEENEKSDNGLGEYTSVKHSFVYDSVWRRAMTSTPLGSNRDYRNLKSPSIITSPSTDSIYSKWNGRNNSMGRHQIFNLTSLKRELENTMRSSPNDKTAILKGVSSIYQKNRHADFDEFHKFPLAWRIPNKGQHFTDNKENHFCKTNCGDECKRLRKSSDLVLSEWSPPTSSSTPNSPQNRKSPDPCNSDHTELHGNQDIERKQRRKVVRLKELLAGRNPHFRHSDITKSSKQKKKLQHSKGKKQFRGISRNNQWKDNSSKSKESQSSVSKKRRREAATSNGEYTSMRESQLDNSGMNIPREAQVCQDVRRITRGLTKTNKENFIGKLVWGSCSGWWPALIVDADHVGMQSEPGKLWVYWIGEARISLLNERTQIESFLQNLEIRLGMTSSQARTRAIDSTMKLLRPLFSCNLTKPYYNWIMNNIAKLNLSLDEIKFHPYPSRIQIILDDLRVRNAKATERYLKKLESEKERERNKPNETKKMNEKLKDPLYQKKPDEAHLPLSQQKPGAIAWAKMVGHTWWPGMIIDYRDCCTREPKIGCNWIMWYGDHQLTEIHHRSFLEFGKGFPKMILYMQGRKDKSYLSGVIQAAKDYLTRIHCTLEEWTLPKIIEYFETNPVTEVTNKIEVKQPGKISDIYTPHIIEQLKAVKNNLKVDDDRHDDIRNSDALRAVIDGAVPLEKLCLKCLKMFDVPMDEHPFFQASLCKACSSEFKPYVSLCGADGKCFHCAICASSGVVLMCGKEDCPRVYCNTCMKHLFNPTTYKDAIETEPWECFLCKQDSPTRGNFILKPRLDWKDKLIDMFRTKPDTNDGAIENFDNKRKLRVLSLFDGLSTGLLVLSKLDFEIEVYYASEIDKDALMVSYAHFGDRIIHLGDVRAIGKEKINEIAPIDLLIGGSPCNDLSLANPARRGLHDPDGTGILFFDYCRIKKLVEKANKGRHLFWLFENVASMPTQYRLEINKYLGQEPDVIDSANFSPQHRLRLYWHNLPLKKHLLSSHEEQDVQDILTPNCQRYSLVKKIRTVTTKQNSLRQGKFALLPIVMEDESDSLWITELEQIFGFPRHFTDVKNLSATKRQNLIGRSWSVQTLTAIFRSLCPYFKCNTMPMT